MQTHTFKKAILSAALFAPMAMSAESYVTHPPVFGLDIDQLVSPQGQDFADGLINVKYSSRPDIDGELDYGSTITVTTSGPYIHQLMFLFENGKITKDNNKSTVYFASPDHWQCMAEASKTLEGKTYSASYIMEWDNARTSSITMTTCGYLPPVIGFYLSFTVSQLLSDYVEGYSLEDNTVYGVTPSTKFFFEEQYDAENVIYTAAILDKETKNPLTETVTVNRNFTIADIDPTLPTGTYFLSTRAGVIADRMTPSFETGIVYTAPEAPEEPSLTIDGKSVDDDADMAVGESGKTVTLTSPEGTTIHWHVDNPGAASAQVHKVPAQAEFTDSGTNSLTLTVNRACTLTYFAKHSVTGATSEPKALTFTSESTAIDIATTPHPIRYYDLNGRPATAPSKGTPYIIRTPQSTTLRIL